MSTSMINGTSSTNGRAPVLRLSDADRVVRDVRRRGRRPGRIWPGRVWVVLASLCVVALLAGCETTPGSGDGARGTAFLVGENLVGEPCRAVPAAPDPAVPGTQAAYDVFCGEWETASAQVASIATDLTPMVLTEGGPWRDRLSEQVSCAPAITTRILDDVTAVALDCAFQQGGWPYQALVTRIGHQTFTARGIPAALPAMERAIGVMSGRLGRDVATKTGALSEEIARLEAKLAGGLYTAGDLSSFRELLRLAQYYNFNELYAEAEQRYREALELQRKVATDDSDAQPFLLMHLALELSNQERFEEAEALFDRAESHLAWSIDPTLEPRLVSYRAIHQANQRNRDGARALAHKATEMRLDLARQYQLAGLAEVFPAEFPTAAGPAGAAVSNLALPGNTSTAFGDVVQSKYIEGTILARQGELDRAEDILADAVEILNVEQRVPRWWLPRIIVLQAEIAEKRGQLGLSEQLLKSGIDEQRKLATGSRIEGLAHIALGRIYVAQDKMTEALDAYRTGFDIIAEQGGGIDFGEAQPFFEAAWAEAKRRPNDRDRLYVEMFQVGQLVRGPVTAQTIALTTARLAASDQEVGRLIRELQDARRRRDQLDATITRAQADPRTLAPQLDALHGEWKAVGNQIKNLERQVQAAAPRYNQLTDSPVIAEDVVAALRPGEAIAQILLGPTSSLGFLVDADGVEAYRIDLGAEQAGRIVAELRYPFEATDKLHDFPVLKSHDLYKRLFDPVADRLAAAEHIIVVPMGPLMSLPFGVLVVEPPSGRPTDYTEVAWLARRQASTLAPSVQSFVNLRTTVKPSRASKPFIGFGDVVPNRDADAILSARNLPASCRDDILRVAAAPALPNTAIELRAVAASLGASEASVITGPMFSEENIGKLDLAEYRIVYFATHALLPYQLTCWSEPLLIASKPVSSSETSDGLLSASEILDLKLDADLVVLSACDTGGPGASTGGESLSGLARAFFYAGARSMLVTHWSIPDQPTVDLMIGTFRGLQSSNLTLAEALRKSQMALIADEDLAHPLSWAAFTVVGDGGQRLAAVGASLPTSSSQAALLLDH